MDSAQAFLSWSTIDVRIEPLAGVFKSWFSSLFEGRVRFFFSREIEPGEPAIPSIYRALNDADFGFIFLSQRTARSPWVIFESGCLNPALREGKVFPLLFDLSPKELKAICPPLADFQAVSLRDREQLRRLTMKTGRLVGLDDAAMISLEERFLAGYPRLAQAIKSTVDNRKVLPDRFSGLVAYNDTIAGSSNFQMPELFAHYRRELFLVGINLNFLLNLRNRTDIFTSLLDSLLEDPARRVRILISDLWDERIRYTYDKIVFGSGAIEFAGLDASLRDAESDIHIDRVVQEHCGVEGRSQIARQLVIKKIGLLSDTFWFVDPDNSALSGSMLFALMTAATGRDRPVYYVNQAEDPTLYSKYHDMCRAAFDLSSDVLWPRSGR